MFGSDSTGGGIGFQFRQIKNDAKRQRACVASGGDPRTLDIGSKGENSKSPKGGSSTLIFLSLPQHSTQHRHNCTSAVLTSV